MDMDMDMDLAGHAQSLPDSPLCFGSVTVPAGARGL